MDFVVLELFQDLFFSETKLTKEELQSRKFDFSIVT